MQGEQGEDMSDLHLLLSPAVSSIKAQKSGLLVSLHNLIKASSIFSPREGLLLVF